MKPKILITNDDGIHARGLWHLWHALKDFADLKIVAPSSERSGAGLGLTLHQPLTIEPVKWEDHTSAWKVSGTPADCVRMAMSVILEETPDLIVSGVNRGSNSGRNVLYSGTIGGTIEGALRKIPGIAFSSEEDDDTKFADIEQYILSIVQHMLEHPLSPGTLLNVNFPYPHKHIKGLRLARQGKGLWVENPDKQVHPEGYTCYHQGGKWSEHPEHDDSDVALLRQGYVTAVPIHIDELTDHKFLLENKHKFLAISDAWDVLQETRLDG